MRQRKLEFVVGIFVILGFIAFAVLAFQVSGMTTLGDRHTYRLVAEFTNIGDLKVRAPVTIAGVTIGRITYIDLNPKTYKALVVMQINERDQIPDDSTANIYTAGIIGANYISITPGFSDVFLKDGDHVENTNPALILQNLIGQFMYSFKNDGVKSDEKK